MKVLVTERSDINNLDEVVLDRDWFKPGDILYGKDGKQEIKSLPQKQGDCFKYKISPGYLFFVGDVLTTEKPIIDNRVFTIEDMRLCYNTAKRRAIMQEAGLEADLGFEDYIKKYHEDKTK